MAGTVVLYPTQCPRVSFAFPDILAPPESKARVPEGCRCCVPENKGTVFPIPCYDICLLATERPLDRLRRALLICREREA